jgi:uncharacterized protein
MLLVYNWPVKKLIWLSVFFNVVLTGVIFIGNAALGWQSYDYDPALASELPVTGDFGRYLYLNFRIDPWRNFLQDMPLSISFTFGNMLLGMILARKGFFQEASSMPVFRRWITLLAFTLGLAGSYVFYQLQTGQMEMSPAMIWLPFVLVACMLVQSLGYICLFFWLFNREGRHRILRIFIPVGQMALTNYVMQSILYLLVFFHCTGLVGLFGHSSLSMTYLVGLGFFMFQVLLSNRILHRFRQGPIERAWRSLTTRLTASAAAD